MSELGHSRRTDPPQGSRHVRCASDCARIDGSGRTDTKYQERPFAERWLAEPITLDNWAGHLTSRKT
jgi:hypothetical protein